MQISPKDAFTKLQSIIEEHTDITAVQQRLIYRGRIITDTTRPNPSNEDTTTSTSENNDTNNEGEDNVGEMLVEDITGLCDGQTIHLVPRPNPPIHPTNDDTNTNDDGNDNTANIVMGGDMFTLAEEGSLEVGLLSLLLGATATANANLAGQSNRRSSIISDVRVSDDANLAEGGNGNGNWRRRSFRIPRVTNGRAANLANTPTQQQDALEPIRQNLLTINTMLRHHTATANLATDTIDHNRRFYRGQWIDCLDTVNQWLEATVIDVVDAANLVHEDSIDTANLATIRSSTAFREQAREPLVRSSNLAGRVDLLHLRDGQTDTQRSNAIQLLLVHYNGWPGETWDEWIRSDSYRIRPFRSRTVNQPLTLNRGLSPRVHAPPVPATNTAVANLADERLGVLSEVIHSVTNAANVLGEFHQDNVRSNDPSLPWGSTNLADINGSSLHRIAPLLDRLGRALVDVAPQLANLANEMEEDHDDFVHSMVNDVTNQRLNDVTNDNVNDVTNVNVNVNQRSNASASANVTILRSDDAGLFAPLLANLAGIHMSNGTDTQRIVTNLADDDDDADDDAMEELYAESGVLDESIGQMQRREANLDDDDVSGGSMPPLLANYSSSSSDDDDDVSSSNDDVSNDNGPPALLNYRDVIIADVSDGDDDVILHNEEDSLPPLDGDDDDDDDVSSSSDDDMPMLDAIDATNIARCVTSPSDDVCTNLADAEERSISSVDTSSSSSCVAAANLASDAAEEDVRDTNLAAFVDGGSRSWGGIFRRFSGNGSSS